MYRPAIVRWPRIPLSNSRLYARILPACVSHAETRYPSRVFRVSTTIERISDTARDSDTANYHSASTLSTLSIDAEITSQRRRGEFWNFHSSFVSDVFLFQVCQEYRCVNHRFTTYFSWTTVFASRNHLWTKSARKSDEGFAIDKVISTSEEKVIVEQGISFLKKKKLISLSMNSNNFTQRRCRLEITREKVERKYK